MVEILQYMIFRLGASQSDKNKLLSNAETFIISFPELSIYKYQMYHFMIV